MTGILIRCIEPGGFGAFTTSRSIACAYDVTGGLTSAFQFAPELVWRGRGGADCLLVGYSTELYSPSSYGIAASHSFASQRHEVSADPVVPVERLAYVQRTLGLNAKQLARVARVTRPTLYSWYDGSIPRMPQQGRIKLVYDVARLWHGCCGGPPVGFLASPLSDGSTLLDLLASEDLSVDHAEGVFKELARLMRNHVGPLPRRRRPSAVAGARSPSREARDAAESAALMDPRGRESMQRMVKDLVPLDVPGAKPKGS